MHKSTDGKESFTPGPWSIDHWQKPVNGYLGISIRPARAGVMTGHQIACIYTSPLPSAPAGSSDEANARLIAAAPELLATLEHFLGRMELSGNWDDGCFYYSGIAAPELQDVIFKARAIVKKARGQ